jgi:F0F1-type ATP synthase membrane subunit b/b'
MEKRIAMNDEMGNSATATDVQALRAELKNLRADFSKITDILRDSARNRGAEAADMIRETAERGWTEAKSTAKTVIEGMEDRPLGTAMAVFVAGVLFGLLVGGRR